MADSFSACEIVELGIQIEKNGKEFYMALAGKTGEPEARKAFKELAEAEEQHISVFEKIFKGACDYEPREAYPEEYFAYMNALASQYVFTRKGKGAEVAGSVSDYAEGITLGIGFEKDSILFYQEMKNMVPESDRGLVERLISEEKEHLSRLCSLKGGCDREEG
ncbi:MAG: hypothetical protein GF408_06235 [Candidatus Omnitrophica bacterium]|nr:hypothetical protein [Candidatus Omnitrophota bacterium]